MFINRKEEKTEQNVPEIIDSMDAGGDNAAEQEAFGKDAAEPPVKESDATEEKKTVGRKISIAGAGRTEGSHTTLRMRSAAQQVSPKLFWAVAVLCGVAIALLSGYTIPISNGPIIMGDELGYWGNAAIFAGKDWHTVMAQLPYYGYGYSLLLVPLFWLGLPMAVMYRVALGMNVAFLLLAFALSYFCLRRLFAALTPLSTLLIAAAATLYTNNLMQAQVGWDETLLYLLYWVLLWQLLELLEKPSALRMALLALTSGYMYMVHMRTVGVVLALGLTVLLFLAAGRIDWKQLLAFFAAMAAMLLVQNFLKSWLNGAVYTGGGMSGLNDYAGQAEKIIRILTTREGFFGLLRSMACKLFYIGAATLLLGFASLRLLFADVFGALWEWIKGGLHRFEQRKLPSVFLLLSFGATYMVNAISMCDIDRMDLPIYGRYMEFAFGPLIAIGLALLVLGRVGIGQALGGSAVLLVLGRITDAAFLAALDIDADPFVATNITTLQRMISTIQSGNYLATLIAVAALIVFFAMWGGQYAFGRFFVYSGENPRKVKTYKTLRPLLRTILPVAIAACTWIWCSAIDGPFTPTKKMVNTMIGQTEDLMTAAQAEPTKIVWVCSDDSSKWPRVWPAHLQMNWVNAELEGLTKSEFAKTELENDALYVAVSGEDAQDVLNERCIKVQSNSYFTLYAAPGSVWVEKAEEMPLILAGQETLNIYYGKAAEIPQEISDEAVNTTSDPKTEKNLERQSDAQDGPDYAVEVGVTSDGTEGLVLYSEGVDAPSGAYEVDFELTLEKPATVQELGQLSLSCDGVGQVADATLMQTDFAPGVRTKVTVTFTSMLDQDLSNLNFQFLANDGVTMTLNRVSYKRVGATSEVISSGSNEMDMLERLMELDYEKHPLYVMPRTSQLESATINDLQSTFGDRKVIVTGDFTLLNEQPGILLIPTERDSQIYALLGEYTIAEKLGNYSVLLPTDSTAYSEFIGHGGLALSDGYKIQLRYYGNENEAPGTVTATPPAGTYYLLMEPSFSNLLTGSYGSIVLTVDGEIVQQNKLDKGTDRDNGFYMPVVVTLDGTEEVSVSVVANPNVSLSNLNVTLRLLGKTPATYGDNLS